jgi:hypothetical protein
MKLRIDAWYVSIPVEKQKELYEKLRFKNWNEATNLISQEYNIRKPSRSAYYRWLRYIEDSLRGACVSCEKKDITIKRLEGIIDKLLESSNEKA